MKRSFLFHTGIMVLLFYCLAMCQTVKRNRDEGTSSIRASNVMGNGNISAFLTGSGSYSAGDFVLAPCIGGAVGITDIMELTGQIVPVSSHGMGPIEAHLQITTPANDKLRLIGVAVFADLFLSTAKDTLSRTSAKDKPEYNSYPAATVVVDLDWLAWKKWLPVKTYLKLSMSDNPDVLFRYDQIAIMSAIEWKMFQHGLFCGVGTAMYKEKQSKTFAGDKGYVQRYAWIEPGARYRLFSRFSILGSAKMTLYQALKETDQHPLKPELFNVQLRLEVPIFFRETNTEAIRSLIFSEQKKEKKPEAVAEVAINMSNGKNLLDSIFLPGMSGGPDLDSLGTFDFSRERQDLIKRREDTQKKMAEIEKLFIEIDKEDSLKAVQNGAIMAPKVQPDSNATR